MKNYNDFISQVGAVSRFPEKVYAKIRFRIVAEKFVLPASLTVSVLLALAMLLSFNQRNYLSSFDITANAEVLLFAQSESFYSLFDDR